MSDILTRKIGQAGHITLTRPKALNALTHPMALAMEKALDDWAGDPEVKLVLLDAEGDRAFCAGGDIAEIYHAGREGDYALGREFWREEYRLNAKIAEYRKPIISFLHGFVMGGGVGIGCLGSDRIVCETTQMAMPECGIGLIPDVGGTYRLAHAAGRMGEYLGLTGHRMGPGDAIYANFADHYVPQSHWDLLKAELAAGGGVDLIARHAEQPPAPPLAEHEAAVDRLFRHDSVAAIMKALADEPGDFAAATLKTMQRNSPLSMAVTLALVRGPAAKESVRAALTHEYRATWRLLEEGDFLEGVRAQIIDKDRQPKWQDIAPGDMAARAAEITAPLGADELNMEEELK